MAKDLDYQKAIILEDRKFDKGNLGARQKKVNAGLEKEFGIKLNEGGGTKQMTVKGGVKQEQTTKANVVKTVVPPKCNLLKIGEKAEGFLRKLETGLDDIKYSLEKVYTGELNFRQNSRLIFGIRYRVCGNEVTYSLVTKETFKNFSKELQGKYAPGNWNVLFDFTNGENLSKFNPIIQASLEKLSKAKTELPKDKVKKKK